MKKDRIFVKLLFISHNFLSQLQIQSLSNLFYPFFFRGCFLVEKMICESIRAWLDRILRRRWVVLIAWQVCSLFLCAIGTICSYVALHYNETIPLLMMSVTYLILFFSSMWKVPKAEISWWRYLVVSGCVVGGDYTAIQAYNNTSFSSALLLLTTVVFWVAPLSFIIFRRKITIFQFFAILLSMTGSVLVFIADGTAGNKWLGNVMALSSAILYAILTVLQELLVHNDSLHLYLFRFSAGAAPLAVILSGSLEWKLIRDYNWTLESGLLMGLYSVLLSISNFLTPFVMQYSDATTMNISMLTSNFYSLAISIIWFGQPASWLYLVGFFCVPIAIVIFTLFGPKETTNTQTITFQTSTDEDLQQPLNKQVF
ncbi:Integral membrane protein [Tritrichomonas foetus]|uniref:Integral membrane protein n=1 Tax=Tritrichomonas foetus TaxID=1144522 RepID=A0A1J4L4H5_9EUKA|nr:Integral membrane protein [Tritrichomonas foetus]|eukprot:OHT16876.1 Integral membrane protein [Tritrichomonas foetus]